MKKTIFILFFCILIVFSGCKGSNNVSPEDKLINAYEKYIDDIIAEYKKTDQGDREAYNNIAVLGEMGNEIRQQIRLMDFNEEQQKKLNKIEQKRREFFEKR